MAKYTKRSINKINQRYMAKREEFTKLPLEELNRMVDLKVKLSYTDRMALGHVIYEKLNATSNEESSNTRESN